MAHTFQGKFQTHGKKHACTLTFHGYARLRTLTPQHSARLCTLGLGDTEVDLLYSHAQVLCRKKIGAGGIFV